MVKTKNKYLYPIDLTKKVKMSYDDSKAHVGRLQYAVDFITRVGTPIMAALDGIVCDVKKDSDIGGDDPSYDKHGNYIEIKHENNEYSIYEHVQKDGSLVRKGDEVKAGQIIGYSGKTGWLAHLGPHLHFDVRKYVGNSLTDYETLEICWKRA